MENSGETFVDLKIYLCLWAKEVIKKTDNLKQEKGKKAH